MKKIIAVLICLLMCTMLSGCEDMREPNSIAYVVAIGIDKSGEKNYNVTIQFAKPVQISGGSGSSGGGGGGGGNITENITIESPTFFSAISMANQIVSKKFDLSHTKLIVFSEEVAREGINNFIQIMSRNSELRPNIYLAVSLDSAQKYLESVKPMIEINPVKYYQLIYENYNSLYAPNNLAQDFSFSENAIYIDTVLPLAGVLPELSSEQSGQSGGGGDSSGGGSGGSSSGGSGGGGEEGGKNESGESEQPVGDISQPPENKMNFEYDTPNYFPGEVPKKTQNKSEVIGMAVFSDDKMVGKMGSIDCEIYNMILGTFSSSYIPYKNSDNEDIITMRIQQEEKPDIKVDTSGNSPKIKIRLDLEGEIVSVPHYYMETENIPELTDNVISSTKEALRTFLYKTSREYNKDICGFGKYAKRNFLTNKSFMEYKWKEKYKNAEFEVEILFTIRRTGLILRTEKNVVKE